MLIHIWVKRIEPLAGTAATEGSEPLRFDGWLELLRVVSELVAAVPSSDEDARGLAPESPGYEQPDPGGAS